MKTLLKIIYVILAFISVMMFAMILFFPTCFAMGLYKANDLMNNIVIYFMANYNEVFNDKKLKQLFIYSGVSLLGMLISHYVPHQYFWYWVAASLIIGHIINLKNYRK